jgi:hypothetical protein
MLIDEEIKAHEANYLLIRHSVARGNKLCLGLGGRLCLLKLGRALHPTAVSFLPRLQLPL